MYEQTLHFTDEAFRPVIEDADNVMQRLLTNMMDKRSTEGTLTIKIDVSLVPDFVPNFDPGIRGDTRSVLTPKFSHKVGSVMQIKDEAKGSSMYDDYELVWDDERCEYVMRPLATSQRSMFDDDFQSAPEKVEENAAALLLPESPEPAEAADQASPFEYLRQFVGQKMQVSEALGNYTVRATRAGAQSVILSSAFSPTHRFYCSAEKLIPHVGHMAECVFCDGTDGNISIVCEDCGEVLFSVNSSETGSGDSGTGTEGPETLEDTLSPIEDGEPEDVSDVFGDYTHEPSAQ